MGSVSKLKAALGDLPDGLHMISVETVKHFAEAFPKPEGATIIQVGGKRFTIVPVSGGER